MTLHIFNPEHDIALASGSKHFTAPHAGRQLREDLCWLPGVWAEDGDAVLVSSHDPEHYDRKLSRAMGKKNIRWVTERDLSSIIINKVEPWGWDAALCHWMKRKGVGEDLLPTDEQLEQIRQLSSRRTAAIVLQKILQQAKNNAIIKEYCQGTMQECRTLVEVEAFMAQHKDCVVKSPWSSSGRGVRFFNDEPDASLYGWIKRTIQQQGFVMLERKERKIQDFAMEFFADGNGNAYYQGLSIFSTTGSAYEGNLILEEEEKLLRLSSWLPKDLLYCVKNILEQELGTICKDVYSGPLGVDMMVIANNGTYGLHPCVEVNVRQTMGMVALHALTQSTLNHRMLIRYDGKYHLSLRA